MEQSRQAISTGGRSFSTSEISRQKSTDADLICSHDYFARYIEPPLPSSISSSSPHRRPTLSAYLALKPLVIGAAMPAAS